jgi:hypothetical protein
MIERDSNSVTIKATVSFLQKTDSLKSMRLLTSPTNCQKKSGHW